MKNQSIFHIIGAYSKLKGNVLKIILENETTQIVHDSVTRTGICRFSQARTLGRASPFATARANPMSSPDGSTQQKSTGPIPVLFCW